MNVKFFSLAIALTATIAHAGSSPGLRSQPPVHVYGNSGFAIDCNAQRTPTIRETNSVLGSRSMVLELSQPQHLADIARRNCANGAARVVFVRDDHSLLNSPMRVVAEVNPKP